MFLINGIKKIMYFLLYLYVILLPLLPSKFNYRGIPFNGDVIFACIVLIYIINFLLSRDFRTDFVRGLKAFFKDFMDISALITVLLMFVSVNQAVDRGIAYNESIRFSSYIILYFIIKYHTSDSRILDNIMRCYIFVSLTVSAIGIFDYATGKISMVRISELGVTNRIASTLENPNNLGAFLMLALFPLITLMIHDRNKVKKIFYGLCILLIAANIGLTGSRNAWLVLCIGIVIITFTYNKITSLIVIAVGSMMLFLPPIFKIVKAFGDMSYNISRIKAWKLALLIAKDHLFTGIGIGNYKYAYKEYIGKYPSLYIEDNLLHPHNAFLKIFSEVGIISLVFFIAFLIIALIRNIKLYRELNDGYYKYFYRGFTISLITFILMNSVDSFLSAPKVIAFFWVLLAVSQSIMYRKKHKTLKYS